MAIMPGALAAAAGSRACSQIAKYACKHQRYIIRRRVGEVEQIPGGLWRWRGHGRRRAALSYIHHQQVETMAVNGVSWRAESEIFS